MIDIIILVVSCQIGLIAIAYGVALYNFICIFINLYPNIKLLDYRIREQIADVLPSYLTSIVMGASIWWIGSLGYIPIVAVTIQVLLGAAVYVAVNRLFKVESMMYFLDIIREKRNQ